MTFLLLHLGVALLRREAVVSDPGIGWHLATGRLILATGTLPRVDPFSFTAAGRPWINYYWLFEIVSALCERVGGLVFFAAVWTVVYGLIPVVMYRNAIRAGASPLAALPVTLAAYAVLVSHAFARPHVVTYLFFAVVVGCIGDVVRDRRTVRSLWWLPVMMTLWVNMHGGFLSGLWAVAVAAAASAAHGLVARDRAELGRAGRLGGLLIAMAIASLANPWGYHLHVQAVEHLGLPSTGYFGEFQSPNFRDGGGPVKTFELLALALTGAGLLGVVQTTWVDIALAVGTLHLALTAVRNMNLFVIVAAPRLACAVTGLVRARWPRVDARWSEIASEQEARGPWVQAAAIASLWLAVGLAGRLPFPTSLVGVRLTDGAAAYIADHPEGFGRAFNQDSFGGVLIDRFWPTVHVFVDDRSSVVYGEDFMMNDYIRVFRVRAGWEDVLDRWAITAAILATGTPCEILLRASPRWRVEYADDRNVIFARVGAAPGS